MLTILLIPVNERLVTNLEVTRRILLMDFYLRLSELAILASRHLYINNLIILITIKLIIFNTYI